MSVVEGFRARLGDHADAALTVFQKWSTDPNFSAWHGLLQAMSHEKYFDELADAFSRVLPFGTGGRRGPVGVGPNRMNPWTLGTSIEGHVRFLRARFGARELAVVVTYDVRGFFDVNQRYPSVSSPLDGLTSRRLAELAARIYAAHGVLCWIQPRGDNTYLATPELSFLIRRLGAQGGLNVSASHNPPDDNGAKVYDEHGGQLVPPDDQVLLDEVCTIDGYQALSWEQAESFLRELEPAHHQAYVDAVAAQAPAELGPLSVTYTALHGVGRIDEILAAAGFDARSFAGQDSPDGAFPTVPGGVANPENPAVFAAAIDDETDAELILATDPDADRIGCMVRHEGTWSFLNGNQIAAVVTDAVLRRWTGPRQALVVKTEVTSTLVTRVATAHGAAVRGDLLVGFKYIAAVMNTLPDEGPQFALGCEESHGLLIGDAMRDKDAGGGGLWLAVAAADARESGHTLVDVLAGFDKVLGSVRNAQVRKTFAGVQGRADLTALLGGLRRSPPVSVGGRAVLDVVDHADPSGKRGFPVSASDAASRNVLVLRLAAQDGDAGARLIWRPSGTEPKLKVYVEVSGSPGFSGSACDAQLEVLVGAVETLLGSS